MKKDSKNGTLSSQNLMDEYKNYFKPSENSMCDYDQSDFKKVSFYTAQKIVYQAGISE